MSTSKSTKTLTLTSKSLFLAVHSSLNSPSPPLSYTLLSTNTSLPPLPQPFPPSKLIPNTQFIVDGFKSSGDHSISYFLSHFHSDHYTGLTPNWSKGIIYCSAITARLLMNVLRINPLFVCPLPMAETLCIDNCGVVLIDANHCPGAVQFMFRIPCIDGSFKKYVHTGDFRYCDSMKCEPLVKVFVGSDAVFLDTTYCNPKFVFPGQDESVDYIVSVIDRAGVESTEETKSVLFLVATYVIGKEKILVEVSRRCKRKIYVDERKMEVLRVLGYGESEVFTNIESESDVHVVGWNVLGETWPYFRPNFVKMKELMVEKGYSKVVGFVPTGWTYEVKRNKFAVRAKDSFEIHLVPYSEHSNYEELREYVKFLKPKHVIPTVGMDIGKLDSKHAIKMKKHFANLVDETANKQEFLMGFRRGSKEMDENDKDASILSHNGLDQDGENESIEVRDVVEDTNSVRVLGSPSLDQERGVEEETGLNNAEKEEIIQRLCDCLPVWVTRIQMLDLINRSGKNFVEAVSNFYEHETEFHEQVIGQSADVSDTISLHDSISLSEQESRKSSPHKNLDLFKSLNHKAPNKLQLATSSLSPGKRKKKLDNKSSKKVKTNSRLEYNGSKQSTITKFFGKLVKNVSQNIEVVTNDDQPVQDSNPLPSDASEARGEKIDQFIQIINSNESSRGYVTTILEKANGDISTALDIYYSNCKTDVSHEECRLASCSQLVEPECCIPSFSSSQELEVVVESRSIAPLSMKVLSSEKVDSASLSLPPEKDLPIEHACWMEGQPAPYLHLARTFQLVEGEKGKIKATSMLCNMFRSLLALSPEDVLPAVYLCTNKIADDNDNMELNIGGSIVTAALEEACGTSRSKIRDMYNSLGDLGDVAEVCRQTQKLLAPPSPLLIKDVFAVLRKISIQTGSGSTGRKKSLIVNLMRSCREMEIKFIVRTLVRNLRIGAMMRTILPALAQAVVLNTYSNHNAEGPAGDLKEKLQLLSVAVVEAYNMLPSLDLLIPSLMSKGAEFSSSTLSMVPGIPIKPMLAKITNGVSQAVKLFVNKAFTCEYKYDGQRAQIHKLSDGSIHVFSRNGDETTSRFPDLINIIKESCKPAALTFILDAEVVAVDRKNGCKLMSFQELSSRERGSKDLLVKIDSIKVDICVFVFDIMLANGEPLLGVPLRDRRKYLKDLFYDEKLGYFEYAKETSVEADDASLTNEATLTKINSFLEDAFCSSCEGIMVKSLDVDAGYRPSKRTDTWLKVKRDYVEGLNDSLDLVPIGAWYGNGRKAGWFSPFLMACYNPDTEEFQSVCRVMSGFSDSFYIEMKDFFSEDKTLSRKPPYYQTAEVPDMWFTPELVWEIRGADFTVSPVHHAAIGLVHPSRGISVRFPRFVCSVLDRKPDECSTAADIADMFHSQTRKMDVAGQG